MTEEILERGKKLVNTIQSITELKEQGLMKVEEPEKKKREQLMIIMR